MLCTLMTLSLALAACTAWCSANADLEEEPDREAHSEDREPDDYHCSPCHLLHDQPRLGTYAGKAFTLVDPDDDPGEFVALCEAGLTR